MDNNDFLGSWAQENVSFATQIIKNAQVGDNYWRTAIFVENDRFVDSTTPEWLLMKGTSATKYTIVTAETYAQVASGLLKQWLYDLFAAGSLNECLLVACGPKLDILDTDDEEAAAAKRQALQDTLQIAYNFMRPYAYHKTMCMGGDEAIDTQLAVAFAEMCAPDKLLLSSCPLYPYTSPTPENMESDALYKALKDAGKDAFMTCHSDKTRNGALLSLGIALAGINSSGTCVGNIMSQTATGAITKSIQPALDKTDESTRSVRDLLVANNIQVFKDVGDNTGNVAAECENTISGDSYAANWVVSYVTYMSKVNIAKLLTNGRFPKNAATYNKCLAVLSNILSLFGPGAAGILDPLAITAPAWDPALQQAKGMITIPNAWEGTYVSSVVKVQVTGTLYIGV